MNQGKWEVVRDIRIADSYKEEIRLLEVLEIELRN